MPKVPAPRRTAAGTAAPPAQQRPPRATLSLSPALRAYLEALGGRSDRGHGPYNFTRLLTRTVALYNAVLEKSDPRETRGLPQGHYELILDALTDPLAFDSFHVVRLGDYLLDLPAFAPRARALALDPRQLRDLLDSYPFAEKLHLVAAAQVRHAPPR